MLTSYLCQNRHGTYYLRIHRKGIDKRVSLRTKDPVIAELSAYRFGVTMRQMDIQKLLENPIKPWGLTIDGDTVDIRTDGSENDHANAMEALREVLKARAAMPPPVPAPSSAPTPAGPAITLAQAIDEYKPVIEKMAIASKSKSMTLVTLGHLMKHTGADLRMPAINDDVIEAWVEHRMTQVGGATVDKELSMIRRFVTWASDRKRRYCPAMTYKKAKTANVSYEHYTGQDLEAIFNALPAAAAEPWQLWIPLIGLYTGARVGEPAALRTEHFFMKAGIPAMHLPGTKTDSSPRDIPIHPDLIDLGLLELVEARRAAGHAKLFDLPDGGENGPGAYPGKWYRDFLRLTAGVNQPKKVFHSFRVTLVDHLIQHGAPPEPRMRYVGHDIGGGVHNKVYGRNGFGLPALRDEVVLRIDWKRYCGLELDFIALKKVADRLRDQPKKT